MGLILSVGACEIVVLLLVSTDAVEKFPATVGVTSGVTLGVSDVELVGVTPGVPVDVLLFPESGGIVGEVVGAVFESVGGGVGVTVFELLEVIE